MNVFMFIVIGYMEQILIVRNVHDANRESFCLHLNPFDYDCTFHKILIFILSQLAFVLEGYSFCITRKNAHLILFIYRAVSAFVEIQYLIYFATIFCNYVNINVIR